MDLFVVGSRVLVSSEDGRYEGTIISADDKRGFYSLEKVLFLDTGKRHPGVLNVMKQDIVDVVQKSLPKTSSESSIVHSKGPAPGCKSTGSLNCFPQPTVGDEAAAATATATTTLIAAASTSPHCPPLCDLQSVSSSSLPNTKGMSKSDSKKQSQTLAVYKVPESRATAFGGIARDEDGAITNGISQPDSPSLPVDYVIIEKIGDLFTRAVEDILAQNCVGLAFEGIDIGRKGQLCWVQIATGERIFLFDVVSFGDSHAFVDALALIMECQCLQKVIHDCRRMSDMLFHRYKIEIVNVFDTQVADLMVYRSLNRGRLPDEVSPLTICLLEHLNISVTQIYSQQARESGALKDEKVWAQRPASQLVIEMAIVRVMYLLELRVRLIEKMLSDFTDGVDIYLGLHRDAMPKRLATLRSHVFMVPNEFLQLSTNAAESRNRATALHRVKQPAVLQPPNVNNTSPETGVIAEKTAPWGVQENSGGPYGGHESVQHIHMGDNDAPSHPLILPSTTNTQTLPTGQPELSFSNCIIGNQPQVLAPTVKPAGSIVVIAGGHESSHLIAQQQRESNAPPKQRRQPYPGGDAVKQVLAAPFSGQPMSWSSVQELSMKQSCLVAGNAATTSRPRENTVQESSSKVPMQSQNRHHNSAAAAAAMFDSSYSSSSIVNTSDDGSDSLELCVIPSSSACGPYPDSRRPGKQPKVVEESCAERSAVYDYSGFAQACIVHGTTTAVSNVVDVQVCSDAAYSSSDDVEMLMPVTREHTPPPTSDWMHHHLADIGSGHRSGTEEERLPHCPNHSAYPFNCTSPADRSHVPPGIANTAATATTNLPLRHVPMANSPRPGEVGTGSSSSCSSSASDNATVLTAGRGRAMLQMLAGGLYSKPGGPTKR